MKKKTKSKVKLMAFGGTAMNVESPQQQLMELIKNSEFAQAKSEYDPLVMGLQGLGGMAASTGMSMVGQGIKDSGGLGEILGNMFKVDFNSGGHVGARKIEVEGKEVYQTPQGQVGEFKGPSHEGGGIPLTVKNKGAARNGQVPEGTYIYPDSIKVDGKTLAERKKMREKKENKLMDLLGGSSDVPLKNTLRRVSESNKRQDNYDRSIQQHVEMEKEYDDMLNHISKNGIPKFDGGGPVSGTNFYKGWKRNKAADPDLFKMLNTIAGRMGTTLNLDDPNSVKAFQTALGTKADGAFGGDSYAKAVEYAMATDPSFAPKINTPPPAYTPTAGSPMADARMKTMEMGSNAVPLTGISGKEEGGSGLSDFFNMNPASMPTFGDALGMAGNLFQAFGPMKNTLNQREGDTPNINPYANYGEDALKTVKGNAELLRGMLDKGLADAELSRIGTTNRNNQSARSINTQRALNLATDSQHNNLKGDMYAKNAEQMMGVNGAIAQTQLDISGKKAVGEQYRDEADRKDRDAFFSNLSNDITAVGEGVSRTGKSLNEIKARGTQAEFLDQMFNNVTGNVMNGKISQKEGIGGRTPQEIISNFKKTEVYTKATKEEKAYYDSLSEQDLVSMLLKLK